MKRAFDMLIVMTHVKLGDFLLITPHLRELQRINSGVVVAIPEMLFELYKENEVLPRAISSRDQAIYIKMCPKNLRIINLTYPLLRDVTIPSGHSSFNPKYFLKPQHATRAYAEALHELLPEFPEDFEAKPFLDMSPNEKVLRRYGLARFEYFTVHSGSDFKPKNWDPEKFEQTVEMLLEQNPGLEAVSFVGPQDENLFQNREPKRFHTVRASLREVAHLLAGSLFHIDNDSGVHHLAGAMDVPSITVFGPTGPGSWASMSDKNFIHWGGPSCENHCEGARMVQCAHRVCLSSVLPEHLIGSAQKILSGYIHI